MAGGGGGDPGLNDSLLETPTMYLSLVFFCFIALSFTFEICVHALRKVFLKRGHPGLAEAVDKAVMEITLLGLVSLILTTFASPLSRICVTYQPWMDTWTLESSIAGCPCCLADTQGISLCGQMAKGCLWNVTDRHPFCDCNVTGSEDFYSANSTEKFEQTAEECLPYPAIEIAFFVDTAANSLVTLASKAAQEDLPGNFTTGDLCEYIQEQNKSRGEYRDNLASTYYWEAPGNARRRSLLGGGGDVGAGHETYYAEKNPVELVLDRNDSDATTVHVLPRTKLFKCTGPFFSSSCPDGQVAAISPTSLHQIHIWLFLIASFHIFISVLQLIMAQTRIRAWRSWERQALAAEAAAAASPAASPPLQLTPAPSAAAPLEAGQPSSAPADIEGGAPEGADALPPPPPPLGAIDVAGGGAANGTSSTGGASGLAGSTPAPLAGGTSAASVSNSGGPGSPRAALNNVRIKFSHWRFQRTRVFKRGGRTRLQRLGAVARESGICLALAFWPNVVTKQHFLLQRQAWLATGPPPPPAAALAGGGDGGSVKAAAAAVAAPTPSFVDHILRCLESDLTTFIGLSVEMLVCLCLTVLLASVYDYLGPTFLLLSGGLMLLTDVTLVALLRFQCRGGRPNAPLGHGQARRLLMAALLAALWWRDPHVLLASPIRLITFLFSFIFATTVFFAWQFGVNSCFFGSAHIWIIWSLPWWIGCLAASLKMCWTGLVTLPAYAVAAHTHRRGHPKTGGGHHGGEHEGGASQHGGDSMSNGKLPPAEQRQVSWADASNGGSGGSAVEAELRAEVARLQARLVQLEGSLAAS